MSAPSDSLRGATRCDFAIIAALISANSRVLDVGCGDGDLLKLLEETRQVDGRGIELSQQGVDQCLKKGLAVVQGDAQNDLATYPDGAFDYVILSQTLQAVQNPKHVLLDLLRIGKKAVVSIPNFGYWRVRAALMFQGRMPVTKELYYSWYDTPNIHFCTIKDFIALVDEIGASVETAIALNRNGDKMALKLPWSVWNLLGQQAVFLLRR